MSLDIKWYTESFIEPIVQTILEAFPSIDDCQLVLYLLGYAKDRGCSSEKVVELTTSKSDIDIVIRNLVKIYAGAIQLCRLFGDTAPSLQEERNIIDKIIRQLLWKHFYPLFINTFKRYAVRTYNEEAFRLKLHYKREISFFFQSMCRFYPDKLVNQINLNPQRDDADADEYEYSDSILDKMLCHECIYYPEDYEDCEDIENYDNLDFSGLTFKGNSFNRMSFKNADFSNSTFVGDGTTATCIHADFTNANLENFVFAGDYEKGCCIKTSIFDDANLRGANLTGICNWKNASFQGADLTNAFIMKEGKRMIGRRLKTHLLRKLGPAPFEGAKFLNNDNQVTYRLRPH